MHTALTQALGCQGATFERIPVQASLENTDDLYQIFANGTARTRATLDMQSDAQRQAIRQAVAAEVAAKFSGVWLMNSSRLTSYSTTVIPGTDAPLLDGRPSGRNSCMVPFDAVVVSAAKPLPAAKATISTTPPKKKATKKKAAAKK